LIKAKISQVRAALADSKARTGVADVVNRRRGEVLLEANKPLTAELWQALPKVASRKSTCLPRADDIAWCFRARWTRMRSALRRKRSSKSTASCARAIHDARNGHESFPRHVFLIRASTLQPRRAPEVQHQDGAGHAPPITARWNAGLRLGNQVTLQAAQNIGNVSTTSTTSATAAFARSANCSKNPFRIGLVRMGAPSRKK